MDLSKSRSIASQAIELIRNNDKKSYTSHDQRLHITYDEWSDMLNIYWMHMGKDMKFNIPELVFRTEIGEVKKEKEDTEWQMKLLKEYSKVSKKL